MDKLEFLARLAKLNLPKGEFIILSGGSLLLRGIRKKTHDIDLCVSTKLADALHLYKMPKNPSGFYQLAPDVEALDNFDAFDADETDGFFVETLESIVQLKKRLCRPKDYKDLKLIEEYQIGQIKIHGVYRHFKGNCYVVEDIIYHSETREAMVAYRSLYDEGRLWARPLAMFLSKVDREKYPKAEQKYRFELQEGFRAR